MIANEEAEQAVLGAAIVASVAHPAVLALQDQDFASSRHRIIAAVLRDMIRSGKATDAVTVQAELRARGQLQSIGGSGYVHDLTNLAPIPSSADYYAQIIRSCTRARMLQVAGETLASKAAAEQAEELSGQLIEWHRTQLAQIPGDLLSGEPDSHTLTSFLSEEDTAEDWITPGLLERGERVVLTGGEGMAKSTILKQFAVCFAGGLHPWTGVRVADGVRVLHIDAENSPRQSRRNYRWIGGLASRRLIAPDWSDRITHHIRNDGVDLPGRDAGWFHQVAAECSPDVIILGPAYKLMRGDPQKDSDVMALLNVIDEVRVRHDAALFMEHHSPHGSDQGKRPIRPYGSSVWLRWPEIGIGLRRDESDMVVQQRRPTHLTLGDWRGAREDRDWPDLIRWGDNGALPWVPTRDDWTPSIESTYTIERELSA